MRGATALVSVFIEITPVFQSTRPMRGATAVRRGCLRADGISIHAPHAGRDSTRRNHRKERYYISIHAPHAGRDCLQMVSKR